MANYNKFIGMGRITKDLELKSVGESKVCNFGIAINDKYTSKAGEVVESVTFVNCVLWNKQAENLYKYQQKGSLILVEGSYATKAWEDKDGNKRTQSFIKVINVQFLGTKPKAEEPEFGELSGGDLE